MQMPVVEFYSLIAPFRLVKFVSFEGSFFCGSFDCKQHHHVKYIKSNLTRKIVKIIISFTIPEEMRFQEVSVFKRIGFMR